jgi:tyrosine aminotransferase
MVTREAISKAFSVPNHTYTPDEIIVASGCSGALEIAITGMLNPGDNILLPNPGFSLYQTITEAHGATAKLYKLDPDRNWEADLEHMESLIDEDTKCILVNNPSNPCGSVFSKDHLNLILALAEKHHLPIITDEIYGNMAFEGLTVFPMAGLTTTVPVVTVGGLGKQFVVPGWRCGWCVAQQRSLQNSRALFRVSLLFPLPVAYFRPSPPPPPSQPPPPPPPQLSPLSPSLSPLS